VKRIIYTAGVWDLLHTGHLNILERSRALGDVLVVGVVSDAGVEAYKGRRPVQDERTRRAVVESLACVDLALIQPTTDPSPILEVLHPAVMTHSDEWERLREGHGTLERLGIEWITIPHTPEVSTTRIRARMGDAA
jgi:cytidyltransferase-like protein